MTARAIVFESGELQALHPLPTSAGCDFCATGVPQFSYPARAAGLGAIVQGDQVWRPISVGSWRACEPCSDLIEAGDWPALARRSLRSLNLDLSQAGPGLRVRLLAQIRAAHETFCGARCGPRSVEKIIA